jgi:hypothetical protein
MQDFGLTATAPWSPFGVSFILQWLMNWLDLRRGLHVAVRRIPYTNLNFPFAHDKHSTIPRNHIRLQIRNKHKYVPLCVLNIAKCRLTRSSNIVRTILIWPVATRQSWHSLPQLGRMSSGGVPRQFGNIEVDHCWSTKRSSTVTFAVITKVLRRDTVKNFSVFSFTSQRLPPGHLLQKWIRAVQGDVYNITIPYQWFRINETVFAGKRPRRLFIRCVFRGSLFLICLWCFLSFRLTEGTENAVSEEN